MLVETKKVINRLLGNKEEMLEKRLVASYKAGETSYLDVLLTSDSLTSFLSNYYFIEQINQYDSELIDTKVLFISDLSKLVIVPTKCGNFLFVFLFSKAPAKPPPL